MEQDLNMENPIDLEQSNPDTTPEPAHHEKTPKPKKKLIKRWWFWLLVVVLILVVGFAVLAAYDYYQYKKNNQPRPDPKPVTIDKNPNTVDDWQFVAAEIDDEMGGGMGGAFGLNSVGSATGLGGGSLKSAMPMAAESAIGFSVGGAKDVDNFRKNIEEGYLPAPTDITYEGLFYDYYFDTGKTEECTKLFCPSYTYAVTPDPFSDKDDYYLSVGLNSGIKESDFQRKKLNLTVVLDVSGSMSSPFNEYYYDQFGNQKEVEIDKEDKGKTKMEVATDSIVALMDHLNPDDRFGMVLFDNTAYLAKPMNLVGETDVDAIKEHIMQLYPMGGTNMSAGMLEASKLYEDISDYDPAVYENRIIFLTDAMPNLGDLSEESLLGKSKKNADNKVFTTYIGIGVDFNTELIESITKMKGANYYSVHSAKEFKTRMDDEFEFMVTPLVFDLNLKLEADGYDIAKVYGSPEANEATGEIMKVNTLFPSKTEAGETRGGVVLLKLKKTSEDGSLKLKTSYLDRNGNLGGDEQVIEFTEDKDYFANTGIQKAVMLTRYADLAKNWLIDEKAAVDRPENILIPTVTKEMGLQVPMFVPLGEWERLSADLSMSDHYKKLFTQFKTYFEKEMKEVADKELEQETKIIDVLLKAPLAKVSLGEFGEIVDKAKKNTLKFPLDDDDDSDALYFVDGDSIGVDVVAKVQDASFVDEGCDPGTQLNLVDKFGYADIDFSSTSLNQAQFASKYYGKTVHVTGEYMVDNCEAMCTCGGKVAISTIEVLSDAEVEEIDEKAKDPFTLVPVE
jgi:Ca-activated chloride channel homolog